jgi:hypothetical protein
MPPSEIDDSVLHAVYRSNEDFFDSPIVMGGQAIEREWGGHTVPFFNVRVAVENGAGEYQRSGFISMKAVYTDDHLFLLLRWSDTTVDIFKDVMFYVGPDIPDTLEEGCFDELVSERNWVRNPSDLFDEDRIAGCQIACHASESPAFGRVGYGRLDIWQWLAARTNLARNLFEETDNPESPLYGLPGYLDDLFADAFAGLSPDPGTPSYRANFREGSDVPIWIYRELDDPLARPLDPDRCWNRFGERCRQNNGVSLLYTWREQIEIQGSF